MLMAKVGKNPKKKFDFGKTLFATKGKIKVFFIFSVAPKRPNGVKEKFQITLNSYLSDYNLSISPRRA